MTTETHRDFFTRRQRLPGLAELQAKRDNGNRQREKARERQSRSMGSMALCPAQASDHPSGTAVSQHYGPRLSLL